MRMSILHQIRYYFAPIIYRRTKAYKKWTEDVIKTKSFQEWEKESYPDSDSYSDSHDALIEELCSLPSYKKWWGLKEGYLSEKEGDAIP